MRQKDYFGQKLILYLVLIVPFLLVSTNLIEKLPEAISPPFKMLILALILTPVIKIWLKLVLNETDFKLYIDFGQTGPKRTLTGMVLGLLAALAVVLLGHLTGSTPRQINPNFTNVAVFKIVFGSLVFFMSESYIEEMVTRGYVLEQFENMHLPYLALIISSLVFVAVQVVWENPGVNLLGWLNLYLLAFLLGLLYLLTASKWLCMGFHTAWNFTFSVIFPPQAGFKHFASYIHMESWQSLILLLAFIAVAFYLYQKRSRNKSHFSKEI